MTPDMVSGIDNSLPLFSNDKSTPSFQTGKGIGASAPDTTKTPNNKTNSVDTVSISTQLQQTIADVKKDKGPAAELAQPEFKKINIGENSSRVAAKVEVVYDLKGDLITKYLDSASRLVYQTPSEIMLHLKEFVSKSDHAVDTKA